MDKKYIEAIISREKNCGFGTNLYVKKKIEKQHCINSTNAVLYLWQKMHERYAEIANV